MVDEVTSQQLASLYERTPQARPARRFAGGSVLNSSAGLPAARAACAPLGAPFRCDARGRVEAETWSRAFAGCAPVPDVLWRDPAPEVRALAVLAWSWTHRPKRRRSRPGARQRSRAAHHARLGPDRRGRRLRGARGRALDPSIEHACCRFGQ